MMRTGRPRASVVILTTVLFWSGAPPASADPGDLDRSFGRRGKVTTRFTPRDDLALAVAIQADGRIVAAGTGGSRRFALSRYRRNGRLDRSFGGDGKVRTRFLGGLTLAHAVGIQPDGRIVAAGGTDDENAFALARYEEDGTLDASLDGDGKVATALEGGHSFALDLAIQPDGRIVAAGTAGFESVALIRYGPDGALDPTFGEGGVVVTDLTSGTDIAFAVAVQPDDRIVVAGRAGGRGGRFAVVRYEPDGSLDGSFGDGGKALTDLTRRHDAARDLAIQPDGRIVVAGFSGRRGRRGDVAVMRFTRHGELDPSFGSGGKVVTTFTKGEDLALGVAIQTDRRIVVVGHAGGRRASPNDHRFAVARYRPNGRLDGTFGRRGKRTVNFTAGDDWAQDVAIQANGKIVAAGRSNRGGGSFGLARLGG